MKTRNIIILILVLIVIVVLLSLVVPIGKTPTMPSSSDLTDTTSQGTGTTDVGNSDNTSSLIATSSIVTFDKTISDSTITLSYPSSIFGLATTQNQLPVKTYIPPCDQGFMYCLYYNTSTYKNTNFESAGISVKKRADLATERLCLNTPPDGFSATTLPSATKTGDDYASSSFLDVSDAAAGHYASGSLYRLFVRSTNSCYEFQTRVGQTQFANYPAGTIKQFTAANMSDVEAQLTHIINLISLPSGERNLFL